MHPFLQFLLFTAGTFALLVVLAGFIKYERLLDQVKKMPDTLTPTERLRLLVARRGGRRGGEKAPFILLLFDAGIRDGEPAEENRPEDLESLFRPLFRSGDELILIHADRLAVLLDTEPQYIQNIASRLVDRLGLSLESSKIDALRMGAASFPPGGLPGGDLLTAAAGTLQPIRVLAQSGGTAVLSGPAALEPDLAAGEEKYVDPLTGVLRPELVIAEARKLILKWWRLDRPVSLLILGVDIDLIRQRFGQEMGDGALRTLGNFLKKNVRETDWIGRLPTDDFLVILNATPVQAQAAGWRWIEKIRLETHQAVSQTVPLSLLIGCAGYPDFHGTAGALFEAAHTAKDAAQYSSSNQCILYTPALRRKKTAAPPVHRSTASGRDKF